MINIEEVYENIYKINIPLTGNPLKQLNSYYIKDSGQQLLLDAGFNRPECEEILRQALDYLGADYKTLNMAATHLHSDHAGLFEAFMGPGRKCYMSEIDIKRSIKSALPGGDDNRDATYNKEGYTYAMLDDQRNTNPAFCEWMHHPEYIPFTHMHSGDILQIGSYEFEWIVVPGHTPGNSVLWEPKRKIMFTGDHILFTITPNISYWDGVDDILGQYLENLVKIKPYPIQLALPAHRDLPDISVSERIDQLLIHHEKRIEEAFSIVKEYPGLRAYEIAGKMQWRIRAKDWDSFPLTQKWFAVGECIAHLDYLIARHRVKRVETDTERRYYPV